jgi:hypothetical protein
LPWAPKVTEVAAGRPDAARAGMVLLKVDARQSRLEAFFYSRSVPFHTNVGTTACDPAGDRVAIGQGVPAKHILFAEGGAKTPVVKELGWFDFVNTLGIPMGVAFDRERNLIYISWPLGGVLYAFDATSFEPKYWRLLEMGVRDIQFDAGRDLLYVAGYRTGRILIFDVASRRVVDHLYVGQKIRDLRFCPDLDVLLVAYVGGFVEIPLGFLPPKMPRR